MSQYFARNHAEIRMLALRQRARVRHGRLLASKHQDRAVVVNVDLVVHRPDQAEAVGNLRLPWEKLADRHAGYARGYRLEDAAHLFGAIGLEVVGLELTGTANAVDEDDGRVPAARAGTGTPGQHL